MESVRVVRIPQLRVVTSGPIRSQEDMEEFDRWWSCIDASHYITPRDFMWYNVSLDCMEWIFAIPEGSGNAGKYETVDFPGGLYAVSTAKDSETASANSEIAKWLSESEHFKISSMDNDSSVRYTMTHVLTPRVFKEKTGYHLSDVFVPIVLKE